MPARRLLEAGGLRVLETGTGDVRLLEVGGDVTTIISAFAPAATYPPVMLANVKGIKPRIYVPIQNTTVSTKQ